MDMAAFYQKVCQATDNSAERSKHKLSVALEKVFSIHEEKIMSAAINGGRSIKLPMFNKEGVPELIAAIRGNNEKVISYYNFRIRIYEEQEGPNDFTKGIEISW